MMCKIILIKSSELFVSDGLYEYIRTQNIDRTKLVKLADPS